MRHYRDYSTLKWYLKTVEIEKKTQIQNYKDLVTSLHSTRKLMPGLLGNPDIQWVNNCLNGYIPFKIFIKLPHHLLVNSLKTAAVCQRYMKKRKHPSLNYRYLLRSVKDKLIFKQTNFHQQTVLLFITQRIYYFGSYFLHVFFF